LFEDSEIRIRYLLFLFFAPAQPIIYFLSSCVNFRAAFGWKQGLGRGEHEAGSWHRGARRGRCTSQRVEMAFAGLKTPSNNSGAVQEVLGSIRARSHASLNPRTGAVQSVGKFACILLYTMRDSTCNKTRKTGTRTCYNGPRVSARSVGAWHALTLAPGYNHER
ncbi:unnamed protein product, partial [Ectocarpus sp. 8 AP-2014]